ncbi:MAG TPA: CAP domain-containing protein [Kineosporiaceae bacterium]
MIAVTTMLLGCSGGAAEIGAEGPAHLDVPASTIDGPSDAPSAPRPPSPLAEVNQSAAPAPAAAPARPASTSTTGPREAASSRAAAARRSASAAGAATRSSTSARSAMLAAGRTSANPSPSPTGTGPVLLLSPPTESVAEAEVVRLVNARREAAGCNAVAVDGRLVELARAHSQDMSGAAGFRHNGSDGRTPFQRMMAAGYQYSLAAENIAAGQTTAAAAMAAWSATSAYQANIVDCRFTEIGVGMVVRPGTPYVVYWTQEFGTPM